MLKINSINTQAKVSGMILAKINFRKNQLLRQAKRYAQLNKGAVIFNPTNQYLIQF